MLLPHSARSSPVEAIAPARPPVHLKLRGMIEDATERLAIRAALSAAHLLGLATGIHLRRTRGTKDPLADTQARLEEANLRARIAWETVEILTGRFQKIPEKQRPYYSPTLRFRILELKSLSAGQPRMPPASSSSAQTPSSIGSATPTRMRRRPAPPSSRFRPSAAWPTSSATWLRPWSASASAAKT